MGYSMQQELEKTFSEAFSLYGDAIFRFSLMKVSNVQLAEDMTQEVFMKYWQYVRAGNEMTNTRSLLYTIANNLAKDWYKRKKADSLDSKMESGFDPESGDLSAEQSAQYEEVLRAIEGMDDTDKEVLLLSYIEGLPPKEISEIVGETANVVSVRLNRALKRLQEKLHTYETA